MTQPIGLICADLLQDRLAELTEHAVHLNVIIGAIAQHSLRVAPVAQCLQRQAVSVVEPVDRAVDTSKQRRLVRDCSPLRASWLLAHRATLRHSACGHPLDISYRYESALARLQVSSVLRGERVPSTAGVPEGPR